MRPAPVQDNVDLFLTAMQILASTNEVHFAKDHPQLVKFNDAKQYNKIVEAAYLWPLYFVKWFEATDDKKTGITHIAFGNKAVYLVDGTTVPKTVKVSCPLSELQLLTRTETALTVLLAGQGFALHTNGLQIEQFLRVHVNDLQSVSNMAVAIRDHQVEDINLLSFMTGDLIHIKEVDPEKGWFHGETGERAGWFSQEYVQVMFAPVTNIQTWYIRNPIGKVDSKFVWLIFDANYIVSIPV